MVTVVSRPIGNKLGTEVFNGAITNASGDALITRYVGTTATPHGLITGDYVYLESDIESYNGFFDIEVITPETYKIYQDGELVSYKQYNQLFYYASELIHGWQCVHLPIVYKLHSDLLPNTVDTITIIGAEYESSPYMNFSLPDSLGFQALDYGLFKSDTDDPGTPYQILSVVSIGGGNSVITINKAQGSSGLYSFQKYYNNYYVLVNVYAGLPSGHHWESEKPYELAGTLKFIPDSNGDVMFSVSELLKGYITTRNNLQLDTLPNNIDFWTSFYIEYTEGYDTSNGTVVTSFVDELTSDQEEFEGQAVNAMLPFKNIYSGWMSEYVGSEESPGRWLTTEDVPLIVDGYYFDLSFIRPVGLVGLLTLRKSFYSNGELMDTQTEPIPDYSEGIYRIEIKNDCQLFPVITGITSIIDNSEFQSSISGWTNFNATTDLWHWNNSPPYFGTGKGYAIRTQESDDANAKFGQDKIIYPGQKLTIKGEFGSIEDLQNYTMKVYLRESLISTLIGTYSFYLDQGISQYTMSFEDTITVPPTTFDPNYQRIFFQIEGGMAPGNVVYVNYFDALIGEPVTEYVKADYVDITVVSVTDTIRCNLVCDCKNTFLNDDLRLLETGGVRELE